MTDLKEMRIEMGPCCFCGKIITKTNIDPCHIKVETQTGLWQMWVCHGECFKSRIVKLDEIDLSPAHF